MKKLILFLLPLSLAACDENGCQAAVDGLPNYVNTLEECTNEVRYAEHVARQTVLQKYREIPRVQKIQNQRPTQE